MKKTILFLLALVAFLIACNDDDVKPEFNGPLFEDWVLFSITGGIHGGGYDAYFSELELEGDSTYQVTNADTLISNGTFSVKIKDNNEVISFDSDNAPEFGFEEFEKTIQFNETKDTLFLWDPCCDLYSYGFRRK